MDKSLLKEITNLVISFNGKVLLDTHGVVSKDLPPGDSVYRTKDRMDLLTGYSSFNNYGRRIERSTLEFQSVILDGGIVNIPTLKGGKIRGYDYRDNHGEYEETVFYGEITVEYDTVRGEGVDPLDL